LQDFISEESAKPVYGRLPYDHKRNQSKIDKAEREIERLLKDFLSKDPE
jgi:hypothetical protein